MGVSLTKGGAVSLTKQAPGLSTVRVGLGWDVGSGTVFDLDASAFLLQDNGSGQLRVRNDQDFIFFNNMSSFCGSVRHSGDNQTGAGDGDDESIIIELNRVPQDVHVIRIDVSVHEGEARRQNFGMVQSAFIRVVNEQNGAELARFDLTSQASNDTGMVFGELDRRGGDWQFRAVGRGVANGLLGSAQECGVNVGGPAPASPPPASPSPPASQGVDSGLVNNDELDDFDF